MAGSGEPDEQLTAERRQDTPAALDPRARGRGRLVLCALLVVVAAAAAAWWLGPVAAIAVYAGGTLALVVALLGPARRQDRR